MEGAFLCMSFQSAYVEVQIAAVILLQQVNQDTPQGPQSEVASFDTSIE